MRPEKIDELLVQAAKAHEMDPAAVERAKRRIVASLSPVRPLAGTAALTAGFLGIFAVVAVAGAAALGWYGWRALGALERSIIFAALAVVACFAAIALGREMRPAGGPGRSGLSFATAGIGLLLVFAFLFHDFGMQYFVRQGIPCLAAGLAFAIPAAALAILVVRRGFVLNARAAGMAAGTLAGLAGIGVLELHCPNLRAMHVMFWHLAVVGISGFVGLAAGRWAERRRSN